MRRLFIYSVFLVIAVSIPYRCNETEADAEPNKPEIRFQFLIGAMRPAAKLVIFHELEVSIPYRCNETPERYLESYWISGFQFLIGAMRPDDVVKFLGLTKVSIPYRCNETVKKKFLNHTKKCFNSL